MRREGGFTLMEVMAAMALLGVVLAGIAPAFVYQMRVLTRNERRSEAMAAAQQTLDNLRTVEPSSLPNSGSDSPETVTVNNRRYRLTTSYCREPSFCTPRTRHLRVEVEYRGEVIYAVETVYTQLR